MEDYIEDIEEQEDGGLFEHYRLTVDPGQSALRIDKFLANQINLFARIV